MFSRFLGRGSKAKEAPSDAPVLPRGLEVVEDDPETVWGLWDSALAEQDSRFAGVAAPELSLEHSVVEPEMEDDSYVPTQPMDLDDLTLEQRVSHSLQIVETHHLRIANTIRTLWGYKECSAYINKLIMAGGDGMGHARIGFNQNAADAMMTLAALHDEQFGVLDHGDGFGFSPSVRAGLDGAR